MDSIWINEIRNEGENIEVNATIGKKIWNNYGENYHLGMYVIMTQEELESKYQPKGA